MRIGYFDEVKRMYEAVVWEDYNNLLLDDAYTAKVEAVKAVKAFIKNYKGNGKLDYYVRFFDFVNEKYNILGTITYDDHHQYTLEDLEDIDEIIVTTEKDAVKLEKFNADNIYALKLKLDLDVEKLLK